MLRIPSNAPQPNLWFRLTNNEPHNSCNATIFLLIYYLPVYFQATEGASPSTSGIRCLPLILAMSIALLASSALVTWMGYFQPLLLAGGILLTVGSALIFTLDIDSSAGKYIGYQILVGVGNGISSQIPLITSLAFAGPEDIALTTALVLCQNYPPIIFLILILGLSLPTHLRSALRFASAEHFHEHSNSKATLVCSNSQSCSCHRRWRLGFTRCLSSCGASRDLEGLYGWLEGVLGSRYRSGRLGLTCSAGAGMQEHQGQHKGSRSSYGLD